MRIRELRQVVQRRTSHPYDTLFVRQVSIFFTAALAPLGISANQVSLLGMGIGFASCAFIAFGPEGMQLTGVGLIHLYAILDSVDGELARLRQQFSLRGLFLEDLSAYYMIVGFPLAVGYYVASINLSNWPVVLAFVYAAFGRNGIAVARRAVIKSIQTKRPASPVAQTARGPVPAIRRLIDDHLLNHTNIRFVVSTILVIELLTNSPPRVTSVLLSTVILGLLAREVATILHMLNRNTLDAFLWQVYEDAKVVNTDASSADGLQLAGY